MALNSENGSTQLTDTGEQQLAESSTHHPATITSDDNYAGSSLMQSPSRVHIDDVLGTDKSSFDTITDLEVRSLAGVTSDIKSAHEQSVVDESRNVQIPEVIPTSEPAADMSIDDQIIVEEPPDGCSSAGNICAEGEAVSPSLPCYKFETVDPYMVACNATVWKDDDCFTKGCKWSPDGTCLLTNSDDNLLRLWNLPEDLYNCQTLQSGQMSNFEPVLKMKESGLIYDCCWYPLMSSWDPVSCCLASASADSPTHLWDAFTGELRATYRAYNQVDEVEAARSVAFDPNGERLYCGFRNCIRVFDVTIPGRKCVTRNLKSTSGDYQTGIVSCIAVSPVISTLYAVGTYLTTVGLYSEELGRALCILRGHEGGITHLLFSPDGLRLYSGGRRDSEILCWDLREPGKVLFSIPRAAETHQRLYFDLTPDGRYLLSGTADGLVHVWDTQDSPSDGSTLSTTIKPFKAHCDCTNGVSLHKQYPLIATSSGQRHLEGLGDSSDDESTEASASKMRKIEKENSVKLWWLGPVSENINES